VTALLVLVVGTFAAAALLRASHRIEAGVQARRLARPSRWRLPTRIRSRLEDALNDAGLRVEPEAACELWLATLVGVAIVGFALSPVMGLLGALGVLAGGPVALHLQRGRARRRLVAALPGALEQIAAGLRGGASVSEAMGAVADGGGPLAPDLTRVCARSALGPGLAGALARWSAERELVSVGATCGALAVASSVGGPAARAIDGLASSLRDRLGAVAEARALSAQARVSAIVVGAAPLAYLALNALVDPGSLDVLLDSGAGRVCLVLGLTFEVAGVLLIRRIVRGEDAE